LYLRYHWCRWTCDSIDIPVTIDELYYRRPMTSMCEISQSQCSGAETICFTSGSSSNLKKFLVPEPAPTTAVGTC
jgi:hypothetical protein